MAIKVSAAHSRSDNSLNEILDRPKVVGKKPPGEMMVRYQQLSTRVWRAHSRRGREGCSLPTNTRRWTRRMSKRASSDLRQSAVRNRRSLDSKMYSEQTRGVPRSVSAFLPLLVPLPLLCPLTIELFVTLHSFFTVSFPLAPFFFCYEILVFLLCDVSYLRTRRGWRF